MQDELEKIRKTRCLPPSKSPLFILVHYAKMSKDWLINSMVGELTFVVFLLLLVVQFVSPKSINFSLNLP